MSSSTAVRGTPRRYLRHFTSTSPFAIRQSPIAAVLARQEPRPPIFIVPRPASHDPF